MTRVKNFRSLLESAKEYGSRIHSDVGAVDYSSVEQSIAAQVEEMRGPEDRRSVRDVLQSILGWDYLVHTVEEEYLHSQIRVDWICEGVAIRAWYRVRHGGWVGNFFDVFFTAVIHQSPHVYLSADAPQRLRKEDFTFVGSTSSEMTVDDRPPLIASAIDYTTISVQHWIHPTVFDATLQTRINAWARAIAKFPGVVPIEELPKVFRATVAWATT